MRVLHVITGLKVGGAERMLQKLAPALRDLGVEQRIVSLTGLDAIGPELRADGFPVEALGMRGPGGLFAALLRLRSRIREFRPDIAQSWLYHADLVSGLAALGAGGTKAVWGIRHSDLSAGANKGSTLAVARLCARLSARLPAGILCNSERALATHSAIGYRAERMRIIPNGFDTSRFRPDRAAGAELRSRLGIPAEAFLFGWVGRNHPQKSPGDFLRAAARLAERDRASRFLMIGEGIDARDPELARLAAHPALAGRVLLAGRRDDLPACYAAMDALVSSSVGEGFSNAIAEGMACGLPVIATDAGDSAAIIAGSGLVCACGDPEGMAARMAALSAETPAERAGRGAEARQRVIARWSLEAVAREYLDYYRGMAADRPRMRAKTGKGKAMGKGQALGAGDLAGYRLNPSTLGAIERARGLARKERAAFRILDFGCGRGRAVIALRRDGFAAYGVDADPVPIENGRKYLQESGEAPADILSVAAAGGIAAPGDGYDFCFSDQVLEHVADLDGVAAVLFRCLRPGGKGRHVFPARWRPVEPHVKMPFFHWLPRSPKVREWAARLWLALGRDPRWAEAEGLSLAAKAALYARYTLEKTRYRSLREIRAAFESRGFRVDFARGGRIPGSAWLRRHFASVQLDLERPGPAQGSPIRERSARAAVPA